MRRAFDGWQAPPLGLRLLGSLQRLLDVLLRRQRNCLDPLFGRGVNHIGRVAGGRLPPPVRLTVRRGLGGCIGRATGADSNLSGDENMTQDKGLIRKHRYDKNRMLRFPAWAGKLAPWLSGDIDTPECYASFEEFRPEEPAGDWFYWYDEVDYAISGECQCTFRTPPTFDKEYRMHLKAGDLFFIRIGTVARFEVIGDAPFVHVIVQMPRPPYTAEEEGGPSFTTST